MPKLVGQSIDLTSSRKSGSKPKDKKVTGESEELKRKSRTTETKKSGSTVAPPQKMRRLIDDDEDDEDIADGVDNDEDNEEEGDDDDVIRSAVKRKKEGRTPNLKLIVGGVVVAVIVIFGFLIFGGKSSSEVPPPSNLTTQQPVEDDQQGDSSTQAPEQPIVSPEVPDDINVGTQNFLDNTTMSSDSPLTDPNNYLKDLYGLSTQVNYTVAKITNATDFVSYTKYRGTWGGGLELYYLDAEYKGNHYVIQVPFQYYKELDDVGIVPVKMEVLRILNEVDGNYLTIISYMCLDEETLNAVLKTQSK